MLGLFGWTKSAQADPHRLFLEHVQFMMSVLKDVDPEGLRIVARNFDTIIEKYKEREMAE